MHCWVQRKLVHSGPLGRRYSYATYLGEDYMAAAGAGQQQQEQQQQRAGRGPRMLLYAEQAGA